MTFKHTLLALSLAFTLNQTVVATPGESPPPYEQAVSNPAPVKNPGSISIKPAKPVKGKRFIITEGEAEITLPHDRTIFDAALKSIQEQGIQDFRTFIKALSKTYFLNLLKEKKQTLYNSMPTREEKVLEGMAKALGKGIIQFNLENIQEGVREAKTEIAAEMAQQQPGEN